MSEKKSEENLELELDTFIKKISLRKIVGYLLLLPPLISVFVFVLAEFKLTVGNNSFNELKYSLGVGIGENYTSALPFYFGLMAIAGAYLIKDNNK